MLRKLWYRRKFDADWYAKTYPDVAKAIDRGLLRHPFDHYWKFGRAEGRLPAKPDFDEAWYLDVYDDVRECVGRGQFTSGYQHFISTGCREGRMGVPLHRQLVTSLPSAEPNPERHAPVANSAKHAVDAHRDR